MHGRKKVERSVTESEDEKRSRMSKIEKYQKAANLILERKQNGVSDDNTLELTKKIILVNVEFYTLWNYRKIIIQELLEKDPLRIQELSKNELSLVEQCLRKNPKSYVAWHHRTWVVENLEVDVFQELKLCNQFLSMDSRNFHCWNYRRFIVDRCKLDPMEEFNYTTKLINDNFSNYSAWHYRSTLLERLAVSLPLDEYLKILENEFEYVRSAFYTEPDDQSAWLYHRWLLSKVSPFIRSTSNLTFEIQRSTQNDASSNVLIPDYDQGICRLEEELNMCSDLLQTEPNCKWALLTSGVLILALERSNKEMSHAKRGLRELFLEVIQLDFMRKGYYLDMLKALELAS